MRAVAAAASPPLRALLLLSRHPRRAGFTNWPSLPRGQNAGPTAPPAATAPKPAAPSRRQGRGLTASLPRQVARISTPHLRPPATPPRCPDRRHQSHGVRALAGCPRKTVRHLPAPTSHLRFTMNPSSSSSSSGGYHSRAAAFASPQPRGGGGRRRGGGRGQDGSDRIDALGRLLTRVLRHMAAELRLDMRTDGYVRVRDLLKLNLQTFAKVPLKSHTVDEIREAVRRDNKQRFSLLEEDGELLIRANQGHTVTTVTSESLLKPILSPDEVSVCVHGTYRKNLDSILQSGLKRMARLHVHFSSGLPSDGEVISGLLLWWVSWVLDSGCTNHMTGEKDMFHTLQLTQEAQEIVFGDSGKSKVIGIGKIPISDQQSLSNVLLVDSLSYNLLSVSQLCGMSYNCLFSDVDVKILRREDSSVAFTGRLKGKLYLVDFTTSKVTPETCLVAKSDKSWL
ncbi:uncharacterized protein [Zea mays]|uniref:uncharacterized protein n=1 Tax=Zea mays TaxID=4577 RepID=UPI00165307D2|nr:uncharacterized protein LOC103638121 [Zea mays]